MKHQTNIDVIANLDFLPSVKKMMDGVNGTMAKLMLDGSPNVTATSVVGTITVTTEEQHPSKEVLEAIETNARRIYAESGIEVVKFKRTWMGRIE